MPRTGTTQSSRLLSGALLCALLLLLSSVTGAQVLDAESEEELSPRALRDFYPKGPNLTSEKQLVSFTRALLLRCMRTDSTPLRTTKQSDRQHFLHVWHEMQSQVN